MSSKASIKVLISERSEDILVWAEPQHISCTLTPASWQAVTSVSVPRTLTLMKRSLLLLAGGGEAQWNTKSTPASAGAKSWNTRNS